MVTIVDYGLGNIQAFTNMYKRMNGQACVATRAEDLEGATHLILPGVGAFDHAMELLQASGMRPALDELVIHRKVPVLGICVGMQILAAESEEGRFPGLGWIAGRVRAFASMPQVATLPLPHMGWNDVSPKIGSQLFSGLGSDARFYFLHSYFFECAEPACAAATANYGIDFACAVRDANVYGVQFHPEKSHHWGGSLLRNFAEL
jgi:glutamine amidotransferase